jgi:hypothetical protein
VVPGQRGQASRHSAEAFVQSGSRGGAPYSALHARSAATISSRVAAGALRGAHSRQYSPYTAGPPQPEHLPAAR